MELIMEKEVVFSSGLTEKDDDQTPWASLAGGLPRHYGPELSLDRLGLITEADLGPKQSASVPHANNQQNAGRFLRTRRGDIRLPAFFPVTTFDYVKYPVDRLLQPYFKRLVDGVMVSYYYAKNLSKLFELPTFVDSGGFVTLFKETQIMDREEYALFKTGAGDELHPREILERQCEIADIAVTLDCLITPNMPLEECMRRQDITLRNALYAWRLWKEKEGESPLLFAAIQAWDADSATGLTEKLAPYDFHGFALGGMVPRISQPEQILEIVDSIRKVDHHRPLHVFGIGKPQLVRMLFDHDVDSVDSSTFIRQGVMAQSVDPATGLYKSQLAEQDHNGEEKDLATPGEIGSMHRVLKNLKQTLEYLGLHGQQA